jgi:hypothetical protein
LLIGVRRDQARIDSEAFPAHQSFPDGALNHCLEHMAKGGAVPKTAVPRFGKGGVVGDAASQAKPAEPPIGQPDSCKRKSDGPQFAQINKPIQQTDQFCAADDCSRPDPQAKLIKQLRLIVLLSSHPTAPSNDPAYLRESRLSPAFNGLFQHRVMGGCSLKVDKIGFPI